LEREILDETNQTFPAFMYKVVKILTAPL